jgi:acetylornithine deacetylase/succinyl-diaminopimelate desuccinylase-like protein
MINVKRLRDQVDAFWEDNIIDSLSEYIEIPNKSPSFDPDWKANGHMDRAMQHVMSWIRDQNIEHLEMELHELPGKTPTLLLEYPASTGISVEGSIDTPINDAVLIYGHLDKQPEFTGWHEGLAPWTAVRREDKLYGRGGGDDGYAIYSAVAIVKMLKDQSLPHPRIVILIEASEESGSPDLPHYMDALNTKIGTPSLVIALDSTCGNYDQLWVTTSLRGMLIGDLKVQVLEQGAHSGAAGGIVGSSFRLLRQLLSRIEDEHSGAILPSFLNEQIPDIRRHEAEAAGEVLSADFNTMYTYAGGSGPISDDPTELVLNNTWQATLEVTGIDGLPDLANAGNVLRPYTTAKFALRLPPTTDAKLAEQQLTELLTENAPNGVEVSFDSGEPAPGWHAPITDPALEAALQTASNTYFGAPAINMGCGGSIPFMEFLAKKLPQSQFVVTGVLGPHSNAHGPNEFLHIPTAKKITCGMASVIVEWGQR